MEVSGKKPPDSTVSRSSEEDIKLFCTPCDRVGPRLPAFGFCTDCKEHLCQSCFDHHKVATLSRKHVLLNKDAMPKTQQSSSTLDKEDNHSSDLTKPCIRHKNKMIEYFCCGHRKLLCNVCVTLEHNPSSCKIKFIPDISDDIIDSQELEDIIEQMNIIIKESQTIGKTCKDLTTESNKSLDKALEDIKMWRKELNNKLDVMEIKVKEKAKYLYQQNEQRSCNTETICEDVCNSVTALKDNIQQTNMAKQADKLFVDVKIAQQELSDYDACIRDLKEAEDICTYHFKPSTDIIDTLNSQTTLGSLASGQLPTTNMRIKQSKPNVPSRTQDVIQTQVPLFTPKDIPYYGDLNVKTGNDKIRCWITGIAQLDDDHLVVADCNNKSVKILHIKKEKIKSVMNLPSKPWDVTVVPNDQLAVTLPYHNMIQILTTKSNTLSKAHSLFVEGQCSGISYCNNKMVVTYTDPPKCEIVDMKGSPLAQISSELGKYTLKDPSYVQTTDQTILISDCGARIIIKLSWQGEVVDIFNHTGQFKGISISTDGKVYVCEQGMESGISQTTADLKRWRTLTTQSRRPQAICCCKNGLLYISNHCYTDKNNFLSIYKTT